ncbi:uncharacterized protein SPPG_06749 [Spizellomyces punctatus DAOM BR117]|uniref:RING-type domain-containing protein n=1 Tax=Spizellomyces punctatus (strain DAOM BR117) TaxID=645134 RepID=A0A0L0HAL6_SPIPD|nr:uncharacterized protein SPPG_06749 [Spizellomyces punctatus DAOM BR117]KNC97748.1 hypothetical protein SPPG_06749 [Spizellomyces punctatus DAOM BR117]|eukprot:XP_016605788.1 hypothetical protein SPPG_06749 [Spizellomyces punctatus DAOM BR117]
MDDSTLKSLSIVLPTTKSVIKFEPAFSPTVKNYTAYVASDTEALQVRASANEPDAFCQILKADAAQSVAIKEGTSDIEIKVDAPDGSSSLYVIQVYRPSGSDATLKYITFSAGSLVPEFHRSETTYLLHVDSCVRSVLCSATPLNPKSKVQLDPEAKLFLGDTPISIQVTSAHGDNTNTYQIIARKEKQGSRPALAPVASISRESICSACGYLVFRPRTCNEVDDKTCAHRFCFTCLDLLKLEFNAGHRSGEYPCPLCPRTAQKIWSSNPSIDVPMEAQLAAVQVACLFAAYGCEQQLDMMGVYDHAQSCTFHPVSCSECEMSNCVKPVEILDGKHKEACTTSCVCGRKIRVADRPRHSQMCPSKFELPSKTVVTQSSWESALVRRQRSPNDSAGCIKAAEENKKNYLRSLIAAKEAAATESFGQSQQRPDNDILEEMANLYATAIALQHEACLGGGADENLHLNLGLVLEESCASKELFPISVATETGPSENDLAQESFMADEVDGLLEQLGIARSASDAVKIRAIESEYQRLKGEGLSDKAAEVQGLYAWKIKQVAATSGTSGWNQGHTKIGITTYSSNVLEKFQHAVAINPENPYANFHLGRALLKARQIPEATKYLRTAVGHKPLFKNARMLLGLALLSSESPTEDILLEGIEYLQEAVREHSALLWQDVKDRNLKRASQIPSQMLVDSFMELTNPFLPSAYVALASGYSMQGLPQQAAEVLTDLIYLIPDTLRRLSRRSATAARLAFIMSEAQRDLIKVLPHCSGPVPKLRAEIISGSLLDVARRYMSLYANVEGIEGLKCDTMESIVQTLVAVHPRKAKFLTALGFAQLDQYDKNPIYDRSPAKLGEAEQSFLAAIEAEGGHDPSQDARLPPGLVSSQKWWIAYQQEMTSMQWKISSHDASKVAHQPVAGKAPAAGKTTPLRSKDAKIANPKVPAPVSKAKIETAGGNKKPTPLAKGRGVAISSKPAR